LAISKAIVDAHDGDIQVMSDEETGTVFRVVLPAGADLPQPAAMRAVQAVASA
jgi:signal transduction histidine kinase